MIEAIYSYLEENGENEFSIDELRTAVNIILQDICSQVYETKEYLPSDRFLKDFDIVNRKRCRFLEQVIVKHKRSIVDKCLIKWKAI